MSNVVVEALSKIKTVSDMVMAFQDEEHCRRLLERLIWPSGRICPACGYREATALAGRDCDGKCRPGLYQCSNLECRHQFTVTTRTPSHATKLPLRVWLTAMWLILQSDKGISSIRLAEALGVSQPTAWRIGHAVRLMLRREEHLDGIVETDEFYIGGSPRKDRDSPKLGRGRKGQPRTMKTPGRAMRRMTPSVTDAESSCAAWSMPTAPRVSMIGHGAP